MKILDEQTKNHFFGKEKVDQWLVYKKQKLFSRHDNSLLTREDGLVYNGNNP